MNSNCVALLDRIRAREQELLLPAHSELDRAEARLDHNVSVSRNAEELLQHFGKRPCFAQSTTVDAMTGNKLDKLLSARDAWKVEALRLINAREELASQCRTLWSELVTAVEVAIRQAEAAEAEAKAAVAAALVDAGITVESDSDHMSNPEKAQRAFDLRVSQSPRVREAADRIEKLKALAVDVSTKAELKAVPDWHPFAEAQAFRTAAV